MIEYKPKVTKIFSIIIGCVGILVASIVLLTVVTHSFTPEQLFGFIKNEKILSDISIIWENLCAPNLLYVALFSILLISIYILFNQQRKKNNLKIVYAAIGVYLAIFLVIDGIFLPAFRDGVNNKSFAKEIEQDNLEQKNNITLFCNENDL